MYEWAMQNHRTVAVISVFSFMLATIAILLVSKMLKTTYKSKLDNFLTNMVVAFMMGCTICYVILVFSISFEMIVKLFQ